MVITVAELLEKIKFDVVYTSETALKKEITTSDVTRPGLEMTGYLEYYTPERIQLFGMKEWSYVQNVIGDNRYDLLKNGVQLYEFKPYIARKKRTWYEVMTGNVIPAK